MPSVSTLGVLPRWFLPLLIAGPLFAQVFAQVSAQEMSRIMTVEPDKGKAGDELTVSGENLDEKAVKEFYLTDGKNDVKLAATARSATQFKFKIPPQAKAGRYSLMLLTTGADPKLIEQPIRVTVE